MGGEWPLVGREAERATAGDVIRSGHGGIVLAGAPGVGKTRLARECLGLAVDLGFAPAVVAATPAIAQLPFGAYATLLPELAPAADRTALVREIARAVVESGRGRPVAVFIDDAHLLDEASAALTYQLAASRAVLLIATAPTGRPASDAVLALWKDGLVDRLELGPLSLADVADLLVAVLAGPTDAATARVVWERTEGNPLFIKELVLGAREAGVLSDEGGVWRLHGRLPASERLVELVESRLGRLSDAEREALSVLAAGEPLGADAFAALVGTHRLDALERRRILRVEQDGRRLQVRFEHPIYGDVLRARVSPLQARAVSRLLADAVEGAGARRREDVLRVATWRLQGGGGDHTLLLAGARLAHACHDLDLAERLARAARETGGGFEAGVLVGLVLSHGGRAEDAEALFASLATEAADDRERAAIAVSRIQNLLLLRRTADALAVAEAAEASIRDPAARADVGAQRAAMLGFSGRGREATELALSLIPDATGATLVPLCIVGAYALGAAGRLAQAQEVSDIGMAAHLALRGAPLPWTVGVQRYIRVDVLSLAGELHQAEAMATRWYEEAVTGRAPLEQAYMSAGLAKTMLRQGRTATAVGWARLSHRLFHDAGRPSEQSYALAYLAHALALQGAAAEAAAALAAFDALPGSGGDEFAPEVWWTRAWVGAAAGDLDGAAVLLAEAVASARALGSSAAESSALHDLARIGHPGDAASRLTELADVVEGPLGWARAAHAGALVARDPVGTEAAACAFEATGALLLAAEAAADAAVAWRSAGEPRRSAGAARRAAALAVRCEGARTPALATGAPARAALSRRELEVARLAATGLANRMIAARLSLSLRTVENKLSSAYAKLGVEGRADLAEALGGY